MAFFTQWLLPTRRERSHCPDPDKELKRKALSLSCRKLPAAFNLQAGVMPCFCCSCECFCNLVLPWVIAAIWVFGLLNKPAPGCWLTQKTKASETMLPFVGKNKLILLIFLAEGRWHVNITQILQGNVFIFQKYIFWGMGPRQLQLLCFLVYGCTAWSASWKARLSSACTILHRCGAKPYRTACGYGSTLFPTITSPSAILAERHCHTTQIFGYSAKLGTQPTQTIMRGSWWHYDWKSHQ